MINVFYDLPLVINYEYTELAESLTVKKWREVFKTLTMERSEWVNEEAMIVNRIDLKQIAKVWVKFLKSTHYTHNNSVT